MVRQHFQVVPTPLPDQVQVALSEVSDPADALILAACKGANYLVLLTYNTRHFLQAKRVRVLTPRNFLERLRRALWEGFR
jgi:predicted nucleic acid-binding protein